MSNEIDTIASDLFAAIERGDLDAVRELYSPEVEIWHKRHILHGKLESGDLIAAPVCLVVYVSRGRIERLFEYLDPATVRGAFE